jgi:exodeoxyribonuclease-3
MLQETKAEDAVFPSKELNKAGYVHHVIHGMKAYNGVAILSKWPLTPLTMPDWCARSDCRSVSARLDSGLELHNFYVPAGGDVPDVKVNPKFAHKLSFLKEVMAWSAGKVGTRCVLAGDLNIAPLPEDVWSHKQLLGVVSHSPIEVESLLAWQRAGDYVDAVRLCRPVPEKLFTWWSYRAADWKVCNRGRRLDHIWVSRNLTDSVENVGIHTEARDWDKPSDHVPVWLDIGPKA